MSSQHQSLVTANIGGKPYGVFETRTGGESSAPVGKYRPGGGMKQKTRKGLADVSDVVIGREWERERDLVVEAELRRGAGRLPIIITDQPLDEDDIAFGKPTIYTGTLMSVNGGDSDSNSDDGRRLELTSVITEVS